MRTHKHLRPTNRRTWAALPTTFTLDDETTGLRLRRMALDPRIDELLIDGRAVRDVSPRGLGLLVALRRLTEARGARMTLIEASPELVALIDRRGLTETLLPAPALATIVPIWPKQSQMTPVLEPVD